MGDFCGADVNVPDVPVPANPTATWGDTIANLVGSQTGLAALNLEDVARVRGEEEAARKAFETETGMPYSDYLAKTAVEESQINKAAMDRYKAALEGTLPVSPALETALGEKKVQTEDQLRRQIGPDYAASSAGLRAMREFDTMAEGLREGARTGAISSAEQLGYASPIAPVTAVNKVNPIQTPTQFNSLFDLYKFNQAAQNQAAMAGYNQKVGAELVSNQNQGNILTGGLNLLGSLGGLYFGGKALGLFG